MARKHDGTHHLNQKVVDLPDLMNNGLLSTGMKEDAAGQEFVAEGARRSTTDPLEINFGDAALAKTGVRLHFLALALISRSAEVHSEPSFASFDVIEPVGEMVSPP
jgi:hypothetical protein